MNILNDEERCNCYEHSHGNTAYTKAKAYGLAIEQAVLAKLREGAEPVAYQHRDGMLSCRLPGGGVKGADWTCLFAHPDPQVAELRAEIASEQKWASFYAAESNTRLATIDELTRQRDELLADVERCYRMLLSEPDTKGALFKAENILREAIAALEQKESGE